MIAVQYDEEARAVYVIWGCTSSENNIWQYGKKKFAGVGGHLFAIAADLSIQAGFDGFIVAEAMDEELLGYYMREFGAAPLPPVNNPYRFMLSDEMSTRLRKVYTYDWTEEEI